MMTALRITRVAGRAGVTSRAARDVANTGIATLASAVAAVAPAYASRGRIADATIAALLVAVFGWVAAFVVAQTRSAAGQLLSAVRARRGVLAGTVIGVVGAATAVGISAATITLGIAGGVIAGGGCVIAGDLGARLGSRPSGSATLGAVTSRASRRRDLLAAWLAVGLAVVCRELGIAVQVLVPALAAAAVGLVTGALLAPVARWLGARALRAAETTQRSGRDLAVGGVIELDDRPRSETAGGPTGTRAVPDLAGGVVAATSYLIRRPHLHRIVALVTAAVSACGAVTFLWLSGVSARHDRAVLDLGAARVLTVQPESPAGLLEAVRNADPSGRYAAAAVVFRMNGVGVGGPSTVVAVDSERVAAVMPGGARSSPTGAELAETIRQPELGVVSGAAGPDAPSMTPIDLTGSTAIDVRTTRFAGAVPAVGDRGVLVDLNDVIALAQPTADAVTGSVTNEVWLVADAPAAVEAALGAQGLRIMSSDGIGERAAAYGQEPAAVAIRFDLIAGWATLLGAALVIGAVVRAHRGARTLIRAIALVAAAWPAGLVGALIARHAGPDTATTLLGGGAIAPPPLVGPANFGLYALVSAIVLAVPVIVVARRYRWWYGVTRPPRPVATDARSIGLDRPVFLLRHRQVRS